MRSVNSARVELQDAKNSATRAKIHQLAKHAFRDALEGFDQRKNINIHPNGFVPVSQNI